LTLNLRILVLLIVGALAYLAGCKPRPNQSKKETIVAKVYDFELKLSEIQKALKGKYEADDSVQVFAEYRQSWIREQTLLHKAKEILTDFEKEKSDLLIQYYNDLLLHELHEKLLQQRLDTSVEEVAIEKYYKKNRRNFELKENILRLQFVKLQNHLVDSEKLWKIFLANDPDEMEDLAQLSELGGGYFFSDDTTWLTFNDILKEIPIVTYNQENYLNNNKYIRLVGDGFTYFVHILEFKVKNNLSPLEFERGRIKNIIVNKRKVELLQLMENEIVEEAYQNLKIETF
jgi:hypothetical protein